MEDFEGSRIPSQQSQRVRVRASDPCVRGGRGGKVTQPMLSRSQTPRVHFTLQTLTRSGGSSQHDKELREMLFITRLRKRLQERWVTEEEAMTL